MQVHYFTFNPFQENTYILYDDSKECVIIDPGCSNGNERKMLDHFIKQEKLKPVLLLNTHCHIDHVLGNSWVSEAYRIPFYMHKDDEPNLRATVSYASVFGLHCDESPKADKYLGDGDAVAFGNTMLDVLHTPGHSPGSISFYCKEASLLISGDVLFERSIGRTDLPGGSMEVLLQSIQTRLFSLPDNTVVLSGHGNQTTIGAEKKHNPFFT